MYIPKIAHNLTTVAKIENALSMCIDELGSGTCNKDITG
jgi:hypothetical protein